MTNAQKLQIAGTIAGLTSIAAGLTTVISPEHTALVSACVGGGSTTILGLSYIVAEVYVAMVGRANTRIDEGAKALAEALARLSGGSGE